MIKYCIGLLSFLFIGSIIISSCERERDPCLQPTLNALRFGIYQAADTGSLGRDSVLPAAAIGLEDSSVGWYYGAKLNKFSIMLSPVADSVKWYIYPDTLNLNANNKDIVTFYYERVLHFVSVACGYTYYYNLTNVTSTNNNIDSIKIVNPAVTNEAGVEHVKIFY